jgi:murein DD-endopeptidase MepM/ murein hydrolase activator NlpD
MLSLIKKTLIPILILASVTTTDAFSLRKRVTAAASTEIITAPLPEPLPFNAVLTDSIININTSKLIVPISDYLRAIDFSDMPEEYDIWSDTKINPYQVNLVNMKDTVKIDMSTFCTPVQSYVTSNFGFRRWRHHYGIDLKVHRGDSVNNAFDGVVRITKRARDYGYYVLVRHFNGLETLYAHLNKITVNPGDTLKAGVPVGLGGNTGRSTGYHLHFEVRYLGNPINPNDIIDFQSFTLKNQIEYKKEIDKIRFWIVRRGDTLGRISQRTGISIAKLCSINGIRRNSILRIGQRIRYT